MINLMILVTNKPKLTVPNEAPFKETVLNEAEEARRLRKEELKQIREAAKENKIKKKKIKKGIEEVSKSLRNMSISFNN